MSLTRFVFPGNRAGASLKLVVVSTHMVGAEVDISVAVLFTELAPWTSMMRCFGRACRFVELVDGADVFWLGLIGLQEYEKLPQN